MPEDSTLKRTLQYQNSSRTTCVTQAVGAVGVLQQWTHPFKVKICFLSLGQFSKKEEEEKVTQQAGPTTFLVTYS